MKILTIGAGVIGVTYSWQLQKAGCQITHLVRQEKLNLYETQGIRIHCLDLRQKDKPIISEIYHPDFTDSFSGSDDYDFILVTVNSHQLAGLLPELKNKSGRADIVFLQNMRMGDDKLIGHYLDRSQYFIAYPFKAGGGRSGNLIETAIFGLGLSDTVPGEVDGKMSSRVKTFSQMLKKAGMNPRIIPDIIAYVRTHYVWAACSVAAYLKAGSYAQFTQSANIRESYRAMRECWEICVKQGFYPKAVIPIKYYYLPFFLLVPFSRWLYAQKGFQEMFEGHIQHSPDEMKDMYFTLLSEVKKYEVEAPVYQNYRRYVENYFNSLPDIKKINKLPVGN